MRSHGDPNHSRSPPLAVDLSVHDGLARLPLCVVHGLAGLTRPAALPASSWRATLVARWRAWPVGVLVVQGGHDGCWLYALRVARWARRRGVGRTLIRRALALAMQHGVAPPAGRVRVLVREEESAAQGLYRGLGFVRLGQHEGEGEASPVGWACWACQPAAQGLAEGVDR